MATLEGIEAKLDVVVEKIKSVDGKADDLKKQQKETTDRLTKYETEQAVSVAHRISHAKRCEERHSFLNKILWTFAVTFVLGAAGIIIRDLVASNSGG